MKAYVHSIETFGTVDGPGVRFVVFLQGCPLRCKYCHNPDTWQTQIGDMMSVDDIVAKYNSCKEFLKSGGITVTGGEALLQIDFLIELFAKFKELEVHTCLDTSGITFTQNNHEKIDKLMSVTDLVLLDIKHIDDEKHIELTGVSNKNILEFALYLSKIKKDVWIRNVIVPTITDGEDDLIRLGEFLSKLKNIKALDLLPYHTMGEVKYKSLGLDIPLKGVREAKSDDVIRAKALIIKGVKNKRKS